MDARERHEYVSERVDPKAFPWSHGEKEAPAKTHPHGIRESIVVFRTAPPLWFQPGTANPSACCRAGLKDLQRALCLCCVACLFI